MFNLGVAFFKSMSNNNISFGQHGNTERGQVPWLLCKTFATKCLFMIVYIFLHLMIFDLILLALMMIFHLGNMQTLNEGMSRVLTL